MLAQVSHMMSLTSCSLLLNVSFVKEGNSSCMDSTDRSQPTSVCSDHAEPPVSHLSSASLFTPPSARYLQAAASQTQDVVSKLFDGESTDSVRRRQTVLPPSALPLLLLLSFLTHCSTHPSLRCLLSPSQSSSPPPLVLLLQVTPVLLLTCHQTELHTHSTGRFLLPAGTLTYRYSFTLQMIRLSPHPCPRSFYWLMGLTVQMLSRCLSCVHSWSVFVMGRELGSLCHLCFRLNSCRLKLETVNLSLFTFYCTLSKVLTANKTSADLCLKKVKEKNRSEHVLLNKQDLNMSDMLFYT